MGSGKLRAKTGPQQVSSVLEPGRWLSQAQGPYQFDGKDLDPYVGSHKLRPWVGIKFTKARNSLSRKVLSHGIGWRE